MTHLKNAEVLQSKIHGKGIFAKHDIKRGECIFYFKGEEKHKIIKNQHDALTHPNWIGISKNKWLEIAKPYVYINHCCAPNAGIKGHVTLTALHDIKEGEEILIDYSITEIERDWKFKCECGSKNCRKVIRSIQYLPKRIFNKYLPFIPTYFQKIYRGDHGMKHA